MLNTNNISPEELLKILNTLSGPICPAGDTTEDGKRLENLKTYLVFLESAIERVNDISLRYFDSPFYSMKQISDIATAFMVRFK